MSEGRTMSIEEYSETSSKKGRGRAKRSIDLINSMAEVAEAAQPITGRGVGYKLFTMGLIPSMSRADMQRVYRLLKEAREEGIIPWDWIVDEGREFERAASWNDPKAFARAAMRSYRRDFWKTQPKRVEVWSEKGTVRGVLAPVLDEYGVGFRVMHGFSSATVVHDVADDGDGRLLIALYVGDYDPSGMYMSEWDLPDRLLKYDGVHVVVERVALTREQVRSIRPPMPSFPATDKRKDPRYDWFVRRYRDRSWEIDALDPNTLRSVVEEAIKAQIDPDEWERMETVSKAESESLREVLTRWTKCCKK
jgi:hypothetical protein